jgi:hypothetical protein
MPWADFRIVEDAATERWRGYLQSQQVVGSVAIGCSGVKQESLLSAME